MSHANYHEPWSFNLEGEYLGMAGDEIGKLKYLRLQLLQEELLIKIPKELRAFVRFHLTVGEQIQVSGVGKIDDHTESFTLKAYQISPVAPGIAQPPNQMPVGALPAEKSVRKKAKAKILVCQKSDCRKRGGRKILAEIEEILRDRKLNEQVIVESTGCLKRCSHAPNFVILPSKQFFNRVHPDEIATALTKRL